MNIDLITRGRRGYSERPATDQEMASISNLDQASRATTTFSIRGANGETNTAHLHPNAKANPAKLAPALTELLSWPSRWSLDANGVILHRHFYVNNDTYWSLKTEITDSANLMNHHPHVVFAGLRSEGEHDRLSHDRLLTLSCTTHTPPGLGMRDVKLANKIEEIIGRHPQIKEMDLEGTVSGHADGPNTAEMKDIVFANESTIRYLVSSRAKES